MASSARSKKSLGRTCWASSKPRLLSLYLLALVFSFSAETRAETGIVSAIGSGKETAEAMVSLLRSVVGKYFRDSPAALSRAILQSEIAPNASSFVQSYKILESRRDAVSLSANVDLDVIQALFSLTPTKIGESSGAKALVVVKGARLPDGVLQEKAPTNPYAPLEVAAKERFQRRQFEVASLSSEEMQAVGAGEDVASPELLRGLGARAGARVALGISSHYEAFENENSHNKELRIVVTAVIVDVKQGALLGKSSITVPEPKGRKDQYAADLQRSLVEEGKDLFHEAFVSAGRKFMKVQGQEDFMLVRVQSPANATLVAKFRGLLESIKELKSVVEFGAQRGSLDLAVRPALKPATLAKLVKALPSEELKITLLDTVGQGEQVALAVQLAPKEVSTEGEVQNDMP